MVDVKIIALALVVSVCAVGGLAAYGVSGKKDTTSSDENEPELAEILNFGAERGAAMFTSITEACTDDDILMPSSDLEELCDEIGDATSMDDLYISCPSDTSTCITFSDFFSKIGYTLGQGNADSSSPDAFADAFLADGNLLCANVAAPCPGSGRRLNLLHNDRMLWSNAVDASRKGWEWVIKKFNKGFDNLKNEISNLNFGCCSENMIFLDPNGDTARCAADALGSSIPSKACGECRYDGMCKDAGDVKFTADWSSLEGAKDFFDGESHSSSNPMCVNTDSANGGLAFGNFGEINQAVSHDCCYYHDFCLANSDAFGDMGKAKYMCDVGIAKCNNAAAEPRRMVGMLAPRKLWWGIKWGLPKCSKCCFRGLCVCGCSPLATSNYACASLQQLMADKGIRSELQSTNKNELECGNHAWAKAKLGIEP